MFSSDGGFFGVTEHIFSINQMFDESGPKSTSAALRGNCVDHSRLGEGDPLCIDQCLCLFHGAFEGSVARTTAMDTMFVNQQCRATNNTTMAGY